ncbi:MAG: toxic anion resistance protein, partial [Erythrobacter sp.]|nr:toxic anion resistance protein [Erythrobacter sp.]
MPAIEPEKAAGLVPVSAEEKTKLDTKVDAFVADLVSVDANSPAFGEKVDQITRMGQEQIRAAAAMSNRFLDRPVRAMDGEGSVGR